MRKSPLFDAIHPNDLEKMLTCLGGQRKKYNKGSFIMIAGDLIDFVGVILSGHVQVIKEDINGNRNIIAELSEGDVFGEAFACAGISISNETILAITDCEIMMIKFKKIVTTCSNACEFHSKLISNMLKIIAQKNLNLNEKIEIITKRTTREKIMSYLLTQAEKNRSTSFEIPFTRNELSDYLCVERSAMSRELGKMQKDGLIKVNKRNFKIL